MSLGSTYLYSAHAKSFKKFKDYLRGNIYFKKNKVKVIRFGPAIYQNNRLEILYKPAYMKLAEYDRGRGRVVLVFIFMNNPLYEK